MRIRSYMCVGACCDIKFGSFDAFHFNCVIIDHLIQMRKDEEFKSNFLYGYQCLCFCAYERRC